MLPLQPLLVFALWLNPTLLQTPTHPPVAQAESPETEAQRLLEEGNAQLEQGDLNGAIAAWQQALERYEALGDMLGQAKALGNLGFAANAVGFYDQALPLYQAALGLARDLGNTELEVNFLANLGLAHSSLEQYELAVGAYEEALPLALAQGNRAGEGAIAGGLAFAHEQLENYERARELYQLMLDVANEQGDAETAAAAQASIARMEAALAGPQSSQPLPPDAPQGDEEAVLQQQLQAARAAQDQPAVALALAELGGWYRDQERLAEAIAAYDESLTLAQALDIPVLVERGLLNLAALYQVVGQFERSRQAAQTLLAVAEAQDDMARRVAALQNLGGVHFATGDMAAAIATYRESLTLIRSLERPFDEAVTLALLAEAHLAQQDSAMALTLLSDALAIAEALQEPELAGALWGSIGKALAIDGDYALAIEALQRNLTSEQAAQNLLGEALAQNNLGTAFFLAGELDAAKTHLQEAIALWEAQRDSVGPSDTLQISVFETQQQAYQTLQQVLVAQGETDAALLVAEQGRGQAIADLLAGRSRSATTALANALAEDELTIADIQQIARAQNATLVEYAITYDPAALFIARNAGQSPEADLFIWVVSPNGDIQFRQVSIPRPIVSLVSGARRAMGVPRGRGVDIEVVPTAQQQRLRTLHQLLIEPIQDLLPDDPTAPVVLIPQRELFLVPFAALPHDGGYLVQAHTLHSAPSIQVLGLTRDLAGRVPRAPTINSNDVLVVGNPAPLSPVLAPTGDPIPLPPLPGAQREAEAIASEIFNTQALTGPAATKAAVLAQMPAAPLIHLATHGLLEYGDPAETGVRDVPGALALATSAETSSNGPSDGLLTAAEILDLDLQATLAVLSACDTGRGDIRGDGVIGLSRSLMAAGVPSVMVSLWAVPDAPTEALMVAFYRRWQGGATKAEALRGAMMSLIEVGHDPLDWAGFTLVGLGE